MSSTRAPQDLFVSESVDPIHQARKISFGGREGFVGARSLRLASGWSCTRANAAEDAMDLTSCSLLQSARPLGIRGSPFLSTAAQLLAAASACKVPPHARSGWRCLRRTSRPPRLPELTASQPQRGLCKSVGLAPQRCVDRGVFRASVTLAFNPAFAASLSGALQLVVVGRHSDTFDSRARRRTRCATGSGTSGHVVSDCCRQEICQQRIRGRPCTANMDAP